MLIDILTHSHFYYPLFLLFPVFMMLIAKNGWEATFPKALFVTLCCVVALYIGVVSEETLKLKKEIALSKPLMCQGKIIQGYTIKDELIVTDDVAFSISWPECKKIEEPK
ncbi:hypothetical protein [Sulfurospirillum multivorans]|uniref:Membrane protein n=2 Tax=Sulfurospirillum multivorans TaxID=66821 RepID=A0AA86ALI2_SULMK|nr:hypothetical protein [Sulfurospirillum multivorans]AHJ13025.1 putative membrane protein [Sulfurospirillum multivorans DSM 12446]QEH06516.1 putative membrane protein [Sulfurospirillum multivorans]